MLLLLLLLLLLGRRRYDHVRRVLPVRVHAVGLGAQATIPAGRAAEWSSVHVIRAVAADLELLGRVGDEAETACRRRGAVTALGQRRKGYTRWQCVPVAIVARQALQSHASGLHASGEADPHPIGHHKRRRQAALSLEGDPHPLVVHVELGWRGDAREGLDREALAALALAGGGPRQRRSHAELRRRTVRAATPVAAATSALAALPRYLDGRQLYTRHRSASNW